MIRIRNAPFFLTRANLIMRMRAYARRPRADLVFELMPIIPNEMSSSTGSSSLQEMSLHQTGVPNEKTSLSSKVVAEDRGCCRSSIRSSVVECLKGEGGRPRLPEPNRPDVPLSHNQYELKECFPCAYKPLHYFVIDRLPFLGWLLQYNVQWLVADVVAGLTVGLMVVPQALAYAKIANLPLKVSLALLLIM